MAQTYASNGETGSKMGFISDLFGNVDNNIWVLAGGLAITIVAIILVVWLLKFAFNASRNGLGNRVKRLGVISTAAVDNKRQLVIIRRDNVEHLIMIGGPTDVVIETGIDPEESVAQKSPAKRSTKPVAQVAPSKAEPRVDPVAAEPSAPAPKQPIPANPASISTTAFARPAPRIVPNNPSPSVDEAPTNVTAIEKLRELGKSNPDSTASSLRYPGILRPVTRHKGVDISKNDQINDDHSDDSDKLNAQEAPKVDVVHGADGAKDSKTGESKNQDRKPANS
jgi:flagellar protein FliO/FliZ